MRYEKKFRISISDYPIFKSLLHTFYFKSIYQGRFISSIYYDSIDFMLYQDSINGVSNRKKIRARFYNDDYSKVYLEEKVKLSDLGFKRVQILNENKNLKKSKLYYKKKYILIPSKVFNFYPVTFINYFRTYYISHDKKTRITLDEKINYSKIIQNDSVYRLQMNIPDKLGVIEIKYDEKDDISINPILNLTSSLNFQLTRNSKYCNSVECLY